MDLVADTILLIIVIIVIAIWLILNGLGFLTWILCEIINLIEWIKNRKDRTADEEEDHG